MRVGEGSGTPSPGCNGSERRGDQGGAAFPGRPGPGARALQSPVSASPARGPPLPPPSARPSRPGASVRPRPPRLGFPLAPGFLQAEFSSAKPRGPQRARQRPSLGDAGGGGGART